MTIVKKIQNQINQITQNCIDVGLCSDQQFPIIVKNGECIEITTPNLDITSCLKNIPYYEMYSVLCEKRSYNMRLLDGALISMAYWFQDMKLMKHRLSFFPSPDLLEYQNEPDIYELDEIYADILDKRVVTVPIRFDYDNTPGVHINGIHPVSHLTIGQYKNCRIAVSSALMPSEFVRFILKHFYNTAYTKYSDKIPKCSSLFTVSITELEKESTHVVIPRF